MDVTVILRAHMFRASFVLLLAAFSAHGADASDVRAMLSFPGAKAASGKRDLVSFPADNVLPQLANGGGWKTSIILVNLSAVRQQFILDFWRPNGTEWVLGIAGMGAGDRITGFMGPGASITIDTDGNGPLAQGWAELSYDFNVGAIGGMAIFRQTVSGRDSEAVVPLTSLFEKESVLPYDNSNNFSTGVAMVNGSMANSAAVTLDYRDQNGTVYLSDTVTLGPKSQLVFSMPVRSAATQGRRGTLHLKSSSDYLSVLGIRFNPGGAFTSVHALSTVDMLR